MIRILQIGLSKNLGGVENCIYNYYDKINKEEFQFDFIDMYGDGLANEDKLVARNSKIWKLSHFKKHPLRFWGQLKKIILEEKYDIIHINLLSVANMLPVFAARGAKETKTIVHIHSAAIPTGGIRRLLNGLNTKIVRRMKVERWACGEKAGRWMWKDRFNVVYNAIDLQRFSGNKVQINKKDEETKSSPDDVLIGFVGQFVEAKNVLFLPHVLYELKKMSPHYRMLIVGDGPYKEALIEEINKLGVVDDIILPGMQKSIEECYKKMDAFVLPSFFEGVPLVAIEAQAMRIPCFLSSSISNEVCVSNYANFIDLQRGAAGWAEQMNDYLTSKPAFEKMPLMDSYDIDLAVKKLESDYRSILGK